MNELSKLTVVQLQILLKEKNLLIHYKVKKDLITSLKSTSEEEACEVFIEESQGEVSEGEVGEGEVSKGEVDESEVSKGKVREGEDITGKESKVSQVKVCKANSEGERSEGKEFEGDKLMYQENNIFEEKKKRESSDSTVKSKEPSRTMSDNNNFTFRDVEESLEKFSGEGGKNYENWIQEFEEIANACNWNEIQKYLYARRLLSGAAKLAVEAS